MVRTERRRQIKTLKVLIRNTYSQRDGECRPFHHKDISSLILVPGAGDVAQMLVVTNGSF